MPGSSKGVQIYSGPVRHSERADRAEWAWWVRCLNCDHLMLARVKHVMGEEGLTCDCGVEHDAVRLVLTIPE